MKTENELTLAGRMKEFEQASRTTLDTRSPIVVRVDGKAFHTYLSNVKLFNSDVNALMNDVAVELCKNMQGAQLAYVQSDEVSVLLHSYKRENSSAWFDGQVQKICSVAASIAAATFTAGSWQIWSRNESFDDILDAVKPAFFDARVFNLPEHEVCNYFIWRQKDAIRNSVQFLARMHFSHKQLDGKNGSEMKEMLLMQKGVFWEKLSQADRQGRYVQRVTKEKQPGVVRSGWDVDHAPLFVENREFVDRHLAVVEGSDVSL